MKIESNGFLVQNFIPGKIVEDSKQSKAVSFFSENDVVEISTATNFPAIIPDSAGIP